MLYKQISDEELVYLYREKNQSAINVFLNRYKVYLYSFIVKTKNMYFIQIEISDLYQIAWIKLIELLDKFDPLLGRVYFFIRLAITREIKDYLNYITRRNIHYSLDEPIFNGKEISYLDIISETNTGYLNEENIYVHEIKKIITNKCDKIDLMLLEHKIQGFSYKEISKMHNYKVKTLDNKLTKTRKIIKEALIERNIL